MLPHDDLLPHIIRDTQARWQAERAHAALLDRLPRRTAGRARLGLALIRLGAWLRDETWSVAPAAPIARARPSRATGNR